MRHDPLETEIKYLNLYVNPVAFRTIATSMVIINEAIDTFYGIAGGDGLAVLGPVHMGFDTTSKKNLVIIQMRCPCLYRSKR